MALIAHFEGREPAAYKLPKEDFYTIGIGATSYPDGSSIGANDSLTNPEVDELF